MMNIHSKFLIHWTGNEKIEKQADEDKPRLYVERLKDDYQYGLYLKRKEEATLRHLKVKHLLRLCFTELKLSQSEAHSIRYGKLGLGFSREFILKRGGRPVIYTPYLPTDGLLEKSLRQAYNQSFGLEEIHRPLVYVLAYIKRMSDRNRDQHYEFYDEMEWRIVYDEDASNQYFTKGKKDGEYRLKFENGDVKVIIFPNEKTKSLSLADDDLKKVFSDHLPIIATLEECKNF
jgi:hypothetical protein